MKTKVRQLKAEDSELAASVTRLMSSVFEEGDGSSNERMSELLKDTRFWLFGAFMQGKPVGGLCAHVIPVTREHASELFVYDIAVANEHQRKDIGRLLMKAAIDSARSAGLSSVFVPADNEDQHALDFYRAIGGQAVTFFKFD